MIISFTFLSAMAASALLSALALGMAAFLYARRATLRSRQARAAVEVAELRLTEAETALAAVAGQLQELLAERDRANAVPSRPSLREAVALSRHGASTEELVSTCRIGQSEARLIQMLYGTNRQRGPEIRGKEFH